MSALLIYFFDRHLNKPTGNADSAATSVTSKFSKHGPKRTMVGPVTYHCSGHYGTKSNLKANFNRSRREHNPFSLRFYLCKLGELGEGEHSEQEREREADSPLRKEPNAELNPKAFRDHDLSGNPKSDA